jgi:hypothetical protein
MNITNYVYFFLFFFQICLIDEMAEKQKFRCEQSSEHFKRLKFNSLQEGEVISNIDSFPLSIIEVIYEAITNKSCQGQKSKSIRKYKKTVSEVIEKWRHDQIIPREHATKLFLKLSEVEQRRIQLQQLITFSVNAVSVPVEVDNPSEGKVLCVFGFCQERSLEFY